MASFAFAENVSFRQLSSDPFGNAGPAPVATTAPAANAPVLTDAPPAAPAEKPNPLKPVKDWLGDNISQIISASVIGYIAFLIAGTGGIGLAVGLAAFLFFMLLKSI